MVEALERRYVDLEKLAQEQRLSTPAKLSTRLKVQRSQAPAAGFAAESLNPQHSAHYLDYISCIAAARQEGQALFELSHELGRSVRLDDTLSMLSARLKRLVPHDAMVVYLRHDHLLVPEYASGENSRTLSALKIPLGQGLSGWVAEKRKPILNGNPAVEAGYDDSKNNTLHTALAVPLEGVAEVVGVLALYRSETSFTQDQLRILLAVSAKLGFTIENVLKYRLAEDSATTDYLTGLPNARSLFVHLDREIARCKRTDLPLAVLVCDLNGFKQVNDRFGNLQRNNLLRIFGGALKDCCREYDYVARMGGDEFGVVSPGLEACAASEMVERIGKIALEVGRSVFGEEIVTASVGQAFYPNHGTNAEQLLAEADRSMYSAKNFHYARAQQANSRALAARV